MGLEEGYWMINSLNSFQTYLGEIQTLRSAFACKGIKKNEDLKPDGFFSDFREN